MTAAKAFKYRQPSVMRSKANGTLKGFTMPPATARLEARISFDLHAALKPAAKLQERTMTDFVIGAVQDTASSTIRLV